MVTTTNPFIAQLLASVEERGFSLKPVELALQAITNDDRIFHLYHGPDFVTSVLIIDNGDQGYRLFVEYTDGVFVPDDTDFLTSLKR